MLDLMKKVDLAVIKSKDARSNEPSRKKRTSMMQFSDDEDEGEFVSDDHGIKSPETELHLYLECGKASDVLKFWENNKLIFPRLYAITRKIFCVPGTTAGVERLFSIAGFVLSNRRLSLTDANFHNHVFAHCNLGLGGNDQSKRKFDDK